MITFYTAVGNYFVKDNKPVILIGNKEYCLDIHELFIWSSLAFQILTEEELKKQFYEKEREAGLEEADFEYYLNRLITRELIASGKDKIGANALYALITNLDIQYIEESFLAKCITFLKFSVRFPLKECKKVFEKEPLEPLEKNILQFIKKHSCSITTIIEYVEKNKESNNIENKDKQFLALETVANLYLKKRINFIRKEQYA